jgi:cardiolipin synthase
LANVLTLGRLLGIPFVVYLLVRSRQEVHYERLALALLVIMQASDVLDGYLARRARRETSIGNPLGLILDPMADKLYIGCTYIALSITHGFPSWVTAIVVSRDLLLVSAWLVRLLMTKVRTIRPNAIGKFADTCQAFLIFAFLLKIPMQLLKCGMFVAAVATLVSGVAYFVQGISEVRHPFQ